MQGSIPTLPDITLEPSAPEGDWTEASQDTDQCDSTIRAGKGLLLLTPEDKRVLTYCMNCDLRVKLGVRGTPEDILTFQQLLLGTFGILCVDCR